MTYKTLHDEIRAVAEIQRCYNARVEEMLAALQANIDVLIQQVAEFETRGQHPLDAAVAETRAEWAQMDDKWGLQREDEDDRN